MKLISKFLILALLFNFNISGALAQEAEVVEAAKTTEEKKEMKKIDLENTLVMELKDGKLIAELRPDLAPKHVARIKELVREGFYDGIVFHRVIEGFMAQTGDPTGTGRGGSGQNLDSEFSSEKHVRGTLSMARAADPNSADSQFFIMFDDSPHLDNNYTVFGKVIEGIENIDKIKRGFGPNGMVSEPDKIVGLKVAADVEYTELPDFLKQSPKAKEAVEGANDNVKTEVKTNEDGSIDVINKTIKKGELAAEEVKAGVKELTKKAADALDKTKPASLQ